MAGGKSPGAGTVPPTDPPTDPNAPTPQRKMFQPGPQGQYQGQPAGSAQPKPVFRQAVQPQQPQQQYKAVAPDSGAYSGPQYTGTQAPPPQATTTSQIEPAMEQPVQQASVNPPQPQPPPPEALATTAQQGKGMKKKATPDQEYQFQQQG